MKELLLHPNAFMWAVVALVFLGIIVVVFREYLSPLVKSVVEALSEMATKNPLLFVLALCLGISATADAIADVFVPIDPDQWSKLGWWQVVALTFKSVKPLFSTIAALLINPPKMSSISGGNTVAPFPEPPKQTP